MEQQQEGLQAKKEYTRSFSELGELQDAHQITYQVQPQDDLWKVSLQCIEAKESHTDQMLLNCGEQVAYTLVRFLYENAIPFESWRDVVADMMPEKAILV